MSKFTKAEIWEKIKVSPLIPVFFSSDLIYTKNIVKACYDGGMRLFEFTNRGVEALAVFTKLSEFIKAECPEMALGIGTIYTAEDAEKFIAAGADFVVQPITTNSLSMVCKNHNIEWVPGAMTLNEIYKAHELGANLIKVFPANILGSEYIKAVKAPMPFVKLMVTGGVEPTETNLKEWFTSGVTCVGMGSQLFKGDFSDDFTPLSMRIKKLLEFVENLTKH